MGVLFLPIEKWRFQKMSEFWDNKKKRGLFKFLCFFQCKVIMCLTEMLRNHAAYEWPRHQNHGNER